MWKYICALILLSACCSAGPVHHQRKNMPVMAREDSATQVQAQETETDTEVEQQAETEAEPAPLVGTLTLPSNATSIRADITDSFSCANKTYGYYADVENDCQIFHVCLPVTYADGKENTFRWSFICPEETIFSQESFTCMRREDMTIECEDSYRYYELNGNFGGAIEEEKQPAATESEPQPEESEVPAPAAAKPVAAEPAVPEPEEEPPKPIKVQKPKPKPIRRKPANQYNKPQRKAPIPATSAPAVEDVEEPVAETVAFTQLASKPLKPQRFSVRPNKDKQPIKPVVPATAAPIRNELFSIRKRPAIFNKPSPVKPVQESEPAVTESILAAPVELSEPQPTLKLQTMFVDAEEPVVQASEPVVAIAQPEAEPETVAVVEPVQQVEIVEEQTKEDDKVEEVKPIEAFEEIPAVIVESLEEKPQEIEQPVEPHVEQPVEQPVEVPVEQPVEQPLVQLVEQPVETPVEQPAEQIPEQPEEQSVAQPEEQSVAQPEEQPMQTAEEPAEKPEEVRVEEPVEEAEELPAVQSIEQPTEQLVEQPVVEPVEQPEEKPVEQLVVQSAELPVEQSENQPTEEEQKQEAIQSEPAILEPSSSDEEALNNIEALEAAKPEDAPVSLPATPEMAHPRPLVEEMLDNSSDNKDAQESLGGFKPVDPVMAAEAEQLITDFLNTLRKNEVKTETELAGAAMDMAETIEQQQPQIVESEFKPAEEEVQQPEQPAEADNVSIEEAKLPEPDTVDNHASVEEQLLETESEPEPQPKLKLRDSPIINIMQLNHLPSDYQIPVQVVAAPEVAQEEPAKVVETQPEAQPAAETELKPIEDAQQPSLATAAYMPSISIDDIVELVKERLDQNPKQDQLAPMELVLTPGAAAPMTLIQSAAEPQQEPEQQAEKEQQAQTAQQAEIEAPAEAAPVPAQEPQQEDVILPIYKRVSLAEPTMSKVQTSPVTASKVDDEAKPEEEAPLTPEVREPKSPSRMDARKRRFLFRADAS